jgi:hypothetical protein
MLNVQKYLRDKSLDDLSNEFSIHVKRHNKYNNIVLFKYNQISTPMNDLTRECRGIILDEADDWKTICYSYKRFPNYGEGWGDNIDFSTLRVYEKVDGSLCQLYHYNNKWHVATSGTPDGSGEVMGTDTTFAELFWETWKSLGYQLPVDTDKCFAFELMTPYNRIVVRHEKPRIVLHGARRLSNLRELNPIVEAHTNGWECVKILPLRSWDDILSASKELDPMESEGYVVCDSNYSRAKVKSPAYVAVSKLKDSTCSSNRQLLEKIRINDHEEFLAYFPEMKDIYFAIKSRYERLLGQIEGFYWAIENIEDKKKFAMLAKDQKFSGLLFAMKNGKIDNFKAGLAEMNIKYLEEWLNIKSIIF